MTIRIIFIAFLLLVLAAILIQDFTGYLPLGLFNTGRDVYTLLLRLSLALVAGSIVVLSINAARGTLGKFAGFVRGAIVFAVVLELCVTIADITLMSRSPGAPLGGPYYEKTSAAGDPLILRKRGGNSPYGFRTSEPYQKSPGETLRVLFLGDSFTEGSGRHDECNYPAVVERRLRAALGREVEVMNAGVSGYGPVQALAMLRELTASGYRFDAVVHNFLVENDFTDDLPGTERHVVAGMAFRFPRSSFVRWFHPLNSRTFRTAMFTRALIRIRYELNNFSAVEPGPCDLDGEHLDELPATLRDIVSRKIADIPRIAGSKATLDNATGAVRAMHDDAAALGIPFAVVVFPARTSVDPELRWLLPAENTQLNDAAGLRNVVRESLPGVNVFDVFDALDARAALYRRADTHLSDLGNVVAGEWVAEQLAGMLKEEE